MTIAACPPSAPPVRGVVVFVPADFKAAFPSFATVADGSLVIAFAYATTLLNNTCGSRVCDAALREQLLNLLVAHITALLFGENGQPPAGVVGRVDKATEGSVSVSAVMDTAGEKGKDWYVQTQWGGLYWLATARFRMFVYAPAPAVCADFAGMGPGWPGGIFPAGQQGGDGFGGGGCGC